MAHGLAFHFHAGTSWLHRWDARCKLITVTALGIAVFRMSEKGLTFFTLLMLLGLTISGIPLKSFFKDLRSWLVFLALIFVTQTMFHPSTDHVWLPAVPITWTGLKLAVFTLWRLLLALCFATLFTFTTRPRDLQNAVTWILQPIPFIPARRVGLMISLTLRFIPLVLDQAHEASTAMKARLGSLNKNPLRRIQKLILPIFRKSILRADELAMALSARGYREDLPVRLPSLPKSQLAPALGLAMLALCSTPSVMDLIPDGIHTLKHWLSHTR